jgi:hypothetical protein
MINWKGFGRKRSLRNLRYYARTFLEGLRKITDISQNTLSLGQDLDSGPPKYEAEVLTAQSKRSV